MTRKECLEKTDQCVNGKREMDYGSPENNFDLIADLWTDYMRAKMYKDVEDKSLRGRMIFHTYIFSEDVAMMMTLLKIARIATGTATEDSFVDLAGYAACGCEIATEGGKE